MNDRASSSGRNRWSSFTMKTLFVAIALFSVALAPFAWRMSYARVQKRTVDSLSVLKGEIRYAQTDEAPPETSLRYRTLGRDYYQNVDSVCLVESEDGAAVTNAALKSLARLRYLRILKIPGAEIDDAGLVSIAALSNLKELRVVNTSITDTGLVHICKLTDLEVLSLRDTQVSDRGASLLTSLTSLKELGIRDTKMTFEGAKHLSQHLPDCIVYFDDGYFENGVFAPLRPVRQSRP